MIKIQNVSKSFKTYDSVKLALKNVSLEIADGQCVVIGGENGSGKSVLMSIISGLEDSFSGQVECLDADGNKVRSGLVFQDAETQILGETPKEDIAFGPKNLGWKQEQVDEAVAIALEKTGLTEKADFPAQALPHSAVQHLHKFPELQLSELRRLFQLLQDDLFQVRPLLKLQKHLLRRLQIPCKQ